MSVYDALEFRIAKRRVQEFTDPIIAKHHVAMDCYDCEDFLTKGIRACESLQRLAATLREAIYLDFVELDQELRRVILEMYSQWLAKCDEAEAWIAEVRANGHFPTNMAELRECREVIEDRIQRADWIAIGDKSRARLFSEEPW